MSGGKRAPTLRPPDMAVFCCGRRSAAASIAIPDHAGVAALHYRHCGHQPRRAHHQCAPVVAAALLFAFTADDPADVFAADVFAADVVVALPVVALLAFVENVSIDPATIRATIIAPRRARPRAPAPTVIAPRTGNKRSTACSLSHARARPRARHRVVDCRDDALACAVSI